MAVRQGRSERGGGAYASVRCVSERYDLPRESDSARRGTPLADVFSILLELHG